jgi:RsiW-degrading membrane proteinase PrsW (M82 family)
MLVFLGIFVLSYAPGLFWLWYFYRRDALEPEPKKLVIQTFGLGILAVIPAVVLELPFRNTGVAGSVIVAPIAEEFSKFLIVWLTVYRNKEFDEPMDGIVYAAAAALGFASLENIGYFWRAYENDCLSTTVFLRTLFSVPGHALFSCMWGYALGIKKCYAPKNRTIVVSGLIVSVVLHGLFNGLLVQSTHTGLAIVIFFIFIPIMWSMVHRRIIHTISISPHKERKGEE